MHVPDAPADLVLLGGRVVTMDGAQHTAGALAVRDGRILAVGGSSDIARLAGPRTRRIDLRGRTVLPGFQDAHVHVAIAAAGFAGCRLHDLPATVGGVPRRDRRLRGPTARGPVGAGRRLVPRRVPGRDTHRGPARPRRARPPGVLRQPRHPRRVGQHAGPGGGRHHGAHARPAPRTDRTGSRWGAQRHAARERRRPGPAAHARRRRRRSGCSGLQEAQAYLHRLGITAWQDAWVTPDDLAAYRLFAERGQLTGRVTACQWWDRERGGEQIEELVEGRRVGTIGRLQAGTVKIMQDGVAENQTAAMLVAVPRCRRTSRRPTPARASSSRRRSSATSTARRAGLPGPLPRHR